MVGRLIRLGLTAFALLSIAEPAWAIPVAVFTAIGLSATLATIAAVVVNIGISLLVGVLFGPKTPKPKAEANATTLQLGEVARQALFGRVATAGSLVDAFDKGGKYDTKFETIIFAIADHKCHGLVGVYVNDKFYAITATGPVTGYPGNGSPPYTLYLTWQDGSAGQTLPTTLTAGSADPGEGNSGISGPKSFTNDDFNGIAYITMSYKADKPGATDPKFPAGRPRFLFVVDGKRCYDPRKDSTVLGGSGAHRWADPATWEWTDNPIVCRYNYERGIYALDQVSQPEMLLVGRGLTETEAPPENVAAYANTCDELVALGAGGTEKRYTCSAVINADEDFISVEEKFAACCGGIIIQPGGSVEVEPGVSKVAASAITDDDLIVGAPVRFSNFRSESDDAWINTVVPRYPEPTQKYQDHAAPVRRVYADVIADGKAREQTLTLDYVVSGTQAQRCGEIERRLGRLPRTATITLGPRFAALEEGDWIDWTSDRYANGDVTEWRVEGYSLDEKWQNALTLREIASSVYDWDTSLELDDGSIAGSPTDPPGSLEAPDPADWTLSGETIVGVGGSMPALLITGAVPEDTIEAVDTIVFEYRLYVFGQADDAGWGGASQEPVTTIRKEIRGIAPNTDYDVSIRYARQGYVGARLILSQETAGSIITPSAVMDVDRQTVTIEQDSTGTALAGQYPVVLTFSRQYGDSDVTADTSWSIISRTGSLDGTNCTINDTFGDPDRGKVTITAGIGTVTVQSARTGEQSLAKTVELVAHVNAASSATSTSSLGSISSTSNNTVVSGLVLNASGTSINCTAASIRFRSGSPNGSSNIKLKWQVATSLGGSYTDVGAFVTGSAEVPGSASKYGYIPGADGTITCNQTATGLTPGTDYYFKLIGQSTGAPSSGGSYPITLTGTASISQ